MHSGVAVSSDSGLPSQPSSVVCQADIPVFICVIPFLLASALGLPGIQCVMNIEAEHLRAGHHHGFLAEESAYIPCNFLNRSPRNTDQRDQQRIFIHPGPVVVKVSALNDLKRKRRLIAPADIFQDRFCIAPCQKSVHG